MAGKGVKSKTKLQKKDRKSSTPSSRTTIEPEKEPEVEVEQLAPPEMEQEAPKEDEKEKAEVRLEPVTALYGHLINSWSGACLEGLPHGYGRCEFRSGTTYTGQMTYGLMQGKGEIRLMDGFEYKGEFVKNSLQGTGEIRFPDGSHYAGAVVDGYRHGQGHYAKDDISYTGGWKWGQRHGNGVMRYTACSFYDGHFVDGLEDGFGIRQWENGDIYKGEYKAGARHGRGHMIWRAQQEEYDGEWENGRQNGFGTGTTIKNGKRTVYRGHWKNGQHHGAGRAEYSDGSVLVGEWRYGRKVGQFHVMYSTGQSHSRTDFTDDKITSDNGLEEGVHSLTEKELNATFGPKLKNGKEAIVRNIHRARDLFCHYANQAHDAKFRLMHFDKLLDDFGLSHEVPAVELYADDGDRSPLRELLFRQFARYLVNAAAVLWPEMDLDSAVQKLFDAHLAQSTPSDVGLLFSRVRMISCF